MKYFGSKNKKNWNLNRVFRNSLFFATILFAVSGAQVATAQEDTGDSELAATTIAVTNISEESATIQWGGVEGATTYAVSVRTPEGMTLFGPKIFGIEERSSEIVSLLDPGTAYQVRIVAEDLDGEGEPALHLFITQIAAPVVTVTTGSTIIVTAGNKTLDRVFIPRGEERTRILPVIRWEEVDSATAYEVEPLHEDGTSFVPSARRRFEASKRSSELLGGLTEERGYIARVIAEAESSGLVSTAEGTFAFRTPLFPPIGFTVTPDTETAIVRWNPSDATARSVATSYLIAYTPAGDDPLSEISEVSAGSSELSGLRPNTEYTLSIIAQAEDNAFPDGVSFTSTFDSAPFTTTFVTLLDGPVVSVRDVTTTSATIEWLEVTGATAYRMDLLDENGEIVDPGAPYLFDAGTRSSRITSLLSEESRYVVEIKALAFDDDALINESPLVRFPFSTSLLMPTGFTVTPDTETAIVRWSPSDATTRSAATNYLITFTPAGGDPLSEISEVSAGSSELSGLRPNTEYRLNIIAQAEDNAFPDSAPFITTFMTLFGRPVISVEDITDTGATIEWTEVEDATAYRMDLLDEDGVRIREWPLLPYLFDAGTRSTRVSGYWPGPGGIVPCGQYIVLMNALAFANDNTLIAQSTTVTRTFSVPLAVPVGLINVVPGVTTAQMRWGVALSTTMSESGARSASVENFLVSYLPGDGTSVNIPFDRGMHTLTGLMPATEYTLNIVSQSSDCPGGVSGAHTQTFVTLLADPVVSVTGITQAAALIRWDPVIRAATYEVSLLEVSITTTTAVFGPMELDVDMTNLPVSLNAATQYIAQVVAKATVAGESLASMGMYEFKTPLSRPTPTPTGFVIATSTDTATVSWVLAEVRAGNENPEHFLISYSPDGSAGTRVRVTDLMHTLTNLMPATEYTLNIVAQAQDNAFPDSAPYTKTFKTQLPRPIGFTVAPSTNTATVSWDPSNVGSAERYRMMYTPIDPSGGAMEVSVQNVNSNGRQQLTNLMPATEYQLDIIAQAPTGGFPDSAPYTKTFKTQLPRPIGFTVTPDMTTAMVGWSTNTESIGRVTHYLIEYTPEREGVVSSTVSTILEVSVGSTELSSLTAATLYTLSITAQREGFTASSSYTTIFMTLQHTFSGGGSGAMSVAMLLFLLLTIIYASASGPKKKGNKRRSLPHVTPAKAQNARGKRMPSP